MLIHPDEVSYLAGMEYLKYQASMLKKILLLHIKHILQQTKWA